MNVAKLITALVLVALLSVTVQGGLIAGYNESASNIGGTLWPYSIGWLWNATETFDLTRIETRFGFGPNRRVTIAVYDNLPQLGGVLLASAEYDEVAPTWGGADLGPIPMVAGQDYLISFWNVVDLGNNFTSDLTHQHFARDFKVWYDTDGSPPPSFLNSYPDHQDTAIIRIYGEVIPEPTTLIIWSLLAALGIAAARWRRQRAA